MYVLLRDAFETALARGRTGPEIDLFRPQMGVLWRDEGEVRV
jgi:hypothetical protein